MWLEHVLMLVFKALITQYICKLLQGCGVLSVLAPAQLIQMVQGSANELPFDLLSQTRETAKTSRIQALNNFGDPWSTGLNQEVIVKKQCLCVSQEEKTVKA